MPKLHFGLSDNLVAVRRPDHQKQTDRIPFRELVQQRCPSLLQPFKPAWWLFKCVNRFIYRLLINDTKRSGHLQTLYCVIGDFSRVDQVEYDR